MHHSIRLFLYLDEAHVNGILGVNGYGMSTDFNIENIPHLVMGTFSKAIGVSGAYTESNMKIKNYLINKSAGFIYSTALSPMIIGAAYYGWILLKKIKTGTTKFVAERQCTRTNKTIGIRYWSLNNSYYSDITWY